MHRPSSSPRGVNPNTHDKTPSMDYSRSFPGTKPYPYSSREEPGYTEAASGYISLKDILDVPSTSPPSCFLTRIPLPTLTRRRPDQFNRSNMEVLRRKRMQNKVMPANEADEAPRCLYPPPPPQRRHMSCSYPERLCMQSQQKENSGKCITFIWEEMFKEVMHVLSRITDGIGKLFNSMRDRKHGQGFVRRQGKYM